LPKVVQAVRGLNESKTKSLDFRHLPLASVCGMVLAVWLIAGCTSPMGADKVKMQQAYAQVDANALRTGKPSAGTVSALHRFDLARLAIRQPEEAVRQLHDKALTTSDRDLLFALAELSYVAGNRISRSVKPWDPRDARDYYLGSAVYAWLFLFGEGKDSQPSPFDRRFRDACDLYNYGLGLALTAPRSTNAVVKLTDGLRRLPVGKLYLRLIPNKHTSRLDEVEQLLLADQFRVRGFSVRNRNAGVGTPLIAVQPADPLLGMRRAMPVTVLLRVQGSLAELGTGTSSGALELYSPFDKDGTASIGQARVPLETDLATFRAYSLNQSRIWKLGKLDFLSPAERFPSQLLLNQPFEPDRIPVVFMHGTFSSPVTWAELANSLTADPTLRRHYQMWSFMYGSGNPLVNSCADLRDALTAQVGQLDPRGTNADLRQMVVIGHSQGGLLTKATAVDTADRIWRLVSTNRLEDLNLDETQRAEVRRLLFYEPLPFVKRVVFIATPHRGSYLAGGFVRQLGRWLVELPGGVISRGQNLLRLGQGSEADKFLQGKMPTSLDGMSPKNPGLLALAELPVDSSGKAHSIIPVLGAGDFRQGKDGVVTYQSAHVDYVESEFIVRSKHSCLNQPVTIEEVKRILHEHLARLDRGARPRSSPP